MVHYQSLLKDSTRRDLSVREEIKKVQARKHIWETQGRSFDFDIDDVKSTTLQQHQSSVLITLYIFFYFNIKNELEQWWFWQETHPGHYCCYNNEHNLHTHLKLAKLQLQWLHMHIFNCLIKIFARDNLVFAGYW